MFDKLDDGKLRFKEKIDIHYFGDNVYTDSSTGDYYVGVQKKILAFFALMMNQTRFAPSSGVRVSKNNGKYLVEEVFHDSGRTFVQCVSSVVHHKGKYLLGTVFHNLAFCEGPNK